MRDRKPPRKRPVPMNPPDKFCPECGFEKGTGHAPKCSKRGTP